MEHEVDAGLVFGKDGDVAEVGGVAEDHGDAVEAHGDAAVGRGAVLEGLEHVADLFLDAVFVEAHDLVDAVQVLRAVGADGAAADLVAVADEVVLLGGRSGGVGVEEVERVVGGGAEGVVGEGEAAGFLVGLEEREVD